MKKGQKKRKKEKKNKKKGVLSLDGDRLRGWRGGAGSINFPS